MEKIKNFLVEDEIVIRNGIKNSIEWEKEGYRFVGEASDGELAYPMILKERPEHRTNYISATSTPSATGDMLPIMWNVCGSYSSRKSLTTM